LELRSRDESTREIKVVIQCIFAGIGNIWIVHSNDELVPWSVSLIRHSTAQSILERSCDSDVLSIRVVGLVEMFLEVRPSNWWRNFWRVQPSTSLLQAQDSSLWNNPNPTFVFKAAPNPGLSDWSGVCHTVNGFGSASEGSRSVFRFQS
jgi:hypothetical protein